MAMNKAMALAAIGILGWSCSVEKQIVDAPVVFNERRIELTREYLKDRYRLERDSITITPKMIVLHHTVIPTLEGTLKAFNGPTLPNWRSDIENVSGLNVSSQFVVDRNGAIYRLMPENYMARHVIGLNHCAIGIENVGGTPEMPLTGAQVRANVKLVRYLAKKYPIEYLIGHREYTLFEGHELWLEVDAGYRTEKDDPAKGFLQKVRKATKRLQFKPVPEIEYP